jgi:hypothetical protein
VVNAHFDGAPMLLISGAGPLHGGMGHFQDFPGGDGGSCDPLLPGD